MAVINVRRTAISVKIEGTEGTDSVPAASNVVLANNVVIAPNVEYLARDQNHSDFSNFPMVTGRETGRITFSTELRGSGSALAGNPSNVIPESGVDALWRSCGMDRSLDATSGCYYEPSSSALNASANATSTVYCYYDGLLYKFRGCRGTWNVVIQAGQICRVEWDLMAQTWAISDSAIVDGTALSSVSPLVGKSNTLTVGSYTPIAEQVSYNVQNALVETPSVVSSGSVNRVVITSRNPQMTINPELVSRATFDFIGDYRAGTSRAVVHTIGSTSGNQVKITAPVAVPIVGGYGNRNDIRNLEMTYQLARLDGSDEIRISYL